MFNFTRRVSNSKTCIENVFNIHGYYAAKQLSNNAASSEDPVKAAKPYKEMPKVPMIPFFGSSWAYFPVIGKYNTKKLHKADLHKNKVYGDVVRERFGNFEVVSCYHPEAMSIITEHEGMYPARSEFATLKAYRNKRKEWYQPAGLLIMQGEEWQKLRNSVSDYFVMNGFEWYVPLLQNISQDFVNLMRSKRNTKNEVHDVMDYIYKWALESVSLVALDTRLDCLNPHLDSDSDGMKMIESIHTQLDCINKMEASLGNFPFWKYFPTPVWTKFTEAADLFTAIAYKNIVNSIDNHLSNPTTTRTLLHNLLATENADLSSAMVTVADIMMGGIDTTSNTAAFLLYHLAKNPEKQEKAYKEIIEILPNKDDVFTNELFSKLEYSRYCLRESMRLLPTVRGNLRIFDHDVVLNGYRVPAGTAVLCVLQVIHMNEKYYKDANQFIPERWAKGAIIKNMFTYQPFGYGKRNCLGKRVAEREIISLMAEVLRNFKVEYHYEDMDMYTRLINTPDKPLKLRFLER